MKTVSLSVVMMAAMLGGCAQVQTVDAKIKADLPTAQQQAQAAINLYGIAKGVALVAEVADPTVAPALAAGIAIADPLVAKAQLTLNDATADATAVTALATQITAQANVLTAKAAPVIKVVAAK